MRRRLVLLLVLAALLTAVVAAVPAAAAPVVKCTTIQSGLLLYGSGHYYAGDPLTVGYDAYGYNYQAHRFDGWYPNVYLGREGLPPYEGDPVAYLEAHPEAEFKWYWYPTTRVQMPWNDAWLSNQDCDGDGLLDRHYGYPSYIGSGAWETNHMWDTYEVDGQVCHWVAFTKIVAAPADATLDTGNFLPGYPAPYYDGIWYAADGTEIGPSIWGAFAVIQDLYNDPCSGYHGILYLSPNSAGLGSY